LGNLLHQEEKINVLGEGGRAVFPRRKKREKGKEGKGVFTFFPFGFVQGEKKNALAGRSAEEA